MKKLLNKKSGKNSLLLKELKEAVAEINKIKTGKKKARNAEEFLNELNLKS